MVILSKNNPAVKSFSALKEKKFREQSGTFLVEGAKMVRECAASGLNILRIAVREDYSGDTFGKEPLVLGEDAFRAICDEKTPQGVAAEVEIPVYSLSKPEAPCVLLDGVADPANVGAIIRTAVAAGYFDVYCVSCADPFSPKSVRASMSGVFFARIMQGAREEVLQVLRGIPLVAADMHGENLFTFTPPALFALCVGNEGRGLSQAVAEKAEYTVRIPMDGHTESLNAAVSASIFMYELKKKTFEGM